jgi:hypothetical protein
MKWPLLLPTLLPKRLTSRSEQLVHGVGRLLAKHRKDVRVGVHRDADLRVPEHLHDDLIGNALGKQQRCAPVPQVMQPEPVQASPRRSSSQRRLTLRGSTGVPMDEANTSP